MSGPAGPGVSLGAAFSYYDQSHTGYLQDKDCEEILHTLALFLSRSQVAIDSYVSSFKIMKWTYGCDLDLAGES